MTKQSFPVAAAMLLALAACGPAITDYTSSEAVNEVKLDDASHNFPLIFVPGSDRLARGEAERLAVLVARGEIASRDRVSVSPGGPPALAARRVASVGSVLLHWGILVGPGPVLPVPRNAGVLEVGRYLVTLPPCPNWSKPASTEFNNMVASNFGCATAINLGEMVANPADLASGQPLGPAAGTPAVAAVTRYMQDKVQLPTENSALPIASSSGGAPGGNNNGGSQ
jgi:pilus assembly protein CpaD